MSNKKTREQDILKEKVKKYRQATEKVKTIRFISAAIMFVVLLTFFLSFYYVYNTDTGIEVKTSGWSQILAFLFGGYESANNIFGDIAMPFYYYAENYVSVLGILTTVSAVISIAVLVLEIIQYFIDKPVAWEATNYISLILEIVFFVLTTVIFIVALEMKNARILSVYCGGNPKCSICSLAIIPALISIIAIVVNIWATVKVNFIKSLLNFNK